MEIPQNGEKLSITHILQTVLLDLSEKKAFLLQRLIILAIIMTALESISSVFIDDTNFRVLVIYWFFYAVVFTLFAVTCHRVIILGPNSVPTYGLYSFSMREVRFFGWGFVIYLCMSLITLLIMLTTEVLSFDEELNKYLWILVMYIVFIPGTYIFSRLSILFPATAADHRNDMKWAWDTTKGNGWRLLILLGVVPMFIGFMTNLFAGISISIDTAINFISSILAIFEIAILSHIYKLLSGEAVCSKEPFGAESYR